MKDGKKKLNQSLIKKIEPKRDFFTDFNLITRKIGFLYFSLPLLKGIVFSFFVSTKTRGLSALVMEGSANCGNREVCKS